MLNKFWEWAHRDSRRIAELTTSLQHLAQKNNELTRRLQEEGMWTNDEIERRQEVEKKYNALLDVHNALLERHNDMALYFTHQQRVVSVAIQHLKCPHIQNAELALAHDDQSYRGSLH